MNQQSTADALMIPIRCARQGCDRQLRDHTATAWTEIIDGSSCGGDGGSGLPFVFCDRDCARRARLDPDRELRDDLKVAR